MKGLLFQNWRKGRWKSWQCGQPWMKVVYINSRGDKCLWEVSIVWCKQINHNRLGQHSTLEIATVGKVFPFTFTSHPTSSIISLNHEWHQTTLRETSTLGTQRNNLYSFSPSPSLKCLVCFAPALHTFFLLVLPRLLSSSATDFREWLCVFSPLYIFPKQKNRTIEQLKRPLEVKPLLLQGHPEPAAQDCIQLVSGYLHRWWPCNLLRPPAKKQKVTRKKGRNTRASQHLKTDTDTRGNHSSSRLH